MDTLFYLPVVHSSTMKGMTWNKTRKRWVYRLDGRYYYFKASGKTNKAEREAAERHFQSIRDGNAPPPRPKRSNPAKSIQTHLTLYLNHREQEVALGRLKAASLRSSRISIAFLERSTDCSRSISSIDEAWINAGSVDELPASTSERRL